MSMRIDYKKELNPVQLDAVMSTEGPHLLIAGAGSGKTRTLVYRTAYLVEKGIQPSRILLLTFTRKAAREMLDRSTNILDERCQKVSGGTFHSFANSVLRQNAEAAGLSRSFTILDQSDAENAVKLVRTHQGWNKGDKRFPRKQTLLSIISKSVNKCQDIETILYEEYSHFCEWTAAIQKIKEEYAKYKRSLSLLDYDDLLIYLRDLLETQESLQRTLSQRYQYIMVDEYQDTNIIQARIVQLLTGEHKNIMVVGDDAQSIYSFRGAHFRNIIDFPKNFPGTKIIMLEENYRSSQPILDLTNEVIHAANEKFGKTLFTNNPGKTMPVYNDTVTENDQSRYVVEKILALQAQGVPLNEMAVLFRSGWHSNDLEIELASRGIPFLKYGGQKFVEAAHIKDVMSYMRVAFNPLHEISWMRILMLMRGIGERTASQIIQQGVRQNKGFHVDEKYFKKNAGLKKLFTLLKTIDPGHQPPREVLTLVMEFYVPLLMDHYDDYDKRLNDLESLEKITQRYPSLEQFLSDMTLEPPEKSFVDAGMNREDHSHLVLSTIHSAKGLEWHSVFLIHLTEGYLPSYQSLGSEDAIEEERRLFYVATTRAKKNLFLSRPKVDHSPRNRSMHAGFMASRVSRFLWEGKILQRYVARPGDHSLLTSGCREQTEDFSDESLCYDGI